MEDSLEDLIQHYKTARILPILSDPTSMDSDAIYQTDDGFTLFRSWEYVVRHDRRQCGILSGEKVLKGQRIIFKE